MRGARVPKILRMTAVLVTAGAAIGCVASLAADVLVLDGYDAYGEVSIPGTSKVHLPAGRVTASFHATIVGDAHRGGLPVPHLVLDIDPPAGLANPKVTENVGNSTSVNGDIHRRVWEVQIVTEGDYIVTTGGDVSGFAHPRMAFGHDSDPNDTWRAGTAGLFVLGLIGMVAASTWLRRTQRSESTWPGDTPAADRPVPVASGEGGKIEQLKTLAALRDSGALTDTEFQAEKRRVLDGD